MKLIHGSIPYTPTPKIFGESLPAPGQIADPAVANAVPPSQNSPRDALAPLQAAFWPILAVPQAPLLDQIDALAALRGGPESFIEGAICALQWVLDHEVNPPPMAEAVHLTKEGT